MNDEIKLTYLLSSAYLSVHLNGLSCLKTVDVDGRNGKFLTVLKNECRLKGGLCCLEKSSNDVLAGFWVT